METRNILTREKQTCSNFQSFPRCCRRNQVSVLDRGDEFLAEAERDGDVLQIVDGDDDENSPTRQILVMSTLQELSRITKLPQTQNSSFI